jgi:hypothetical protein
MECKSQTNYKHNTNPKIAIELTKEISDISKR